MPRTITGAKIALLDIDLRKTKMAMGVQVVVTDVAKLEDIRKREADITKERIQLLINAGANVILTTKGIDDMALKYFVEAGAIAVRRVKKEDLRRIAKVRNSAQIGAQFCCRNSARNSPRNSPRNSLTPSPSPPSAHRRHAHDHAGRHGG